MDTPRNCNASYSISQFKLNLLPVMFLAFILLGVTGCFDSETDDAPPSVNSVPVGATPEPSAGATLYADNCAMCHPDSSRFSGYTAAQINAAIVNVSLMNGISLSDADLQSLADYFSASTGGGSGGSGGGSGGGGTLDGQALFQANCAGCHGDGSLIQDPSVSGISAALANLSIMAGVTVTAEEIQAISDFLGGGSGGGGSGAPPATHTNSEDGIMHAPGNTTPFSSGCTVCHGATLSGGVGPSCFTCHGQRWDEGPGSVGGGTGGSGSVDGQALYTTYCSACHGVTGSALAGTTTDQISTAISTFTAMNSISLSLTELQAIADYLVNPGGTGGTGGGDTGGGDTGGGGTGGTLDGQALYTDNCASCHGAIDVTTVNDPSVSGINNAIANLSFMSSISLTAEEIQAISDYLTGGGGGTGGGDTGGGGTGGTLDGQALYTDNCASCHGAIDVTTVNDPSVSGINNAIANLSFMSSISLTAEEIQAISDYLTGGGGGTGGGDTGGGDTGGGGGLPTSHTNSEEGVLHGEGNDYPYTNGCTACHGATLQGGAGPSCYACHGVEWIESAPSSGGDSGGGDTGGGGTGGTLDGATLYADNCSVCHGSGSGINDPSVSGITAAMTSIGSMTGISLTAEEIQAISNHLTGGSGGTGGGDTGGGGTGGTLDGATLYADNCSVCHGSGSGINDPSVSGITAAMTSIGSMTGISLTAEEIQAISNHLMGGSGGTGGGGDTGGGDTGGSSGPPASHTNPEDGILHAPGNNYPYTNGCTLCHGTTLQGGVGPSCFACHGQEWNESAPSGGGDGGGTGGGGTGGSTDGQALYTTYCSACHGVTGSSINNNTASGITSAISAVGSMSSISLTSAEIQAIADYLAGSTGGSTGGGGDTGGLPTTHTNSEQGVLHGPGNNYPYTNGCTSCHGATLQGGVGPSCYSCHGQEWTESAPSGGDSSDSGGSEEEHD